MYVGGKDVTCFPSTAQDIKNEIGAMVTDFVIYPDAAHESFATKVDQEFVDRIAKQLGYKTEDSLFLQ